MDIRQTQVGAVSIVGPRGPLIGDDVESLRKVVEPVQTQRLGRFVVDLAGLPFVDSRGLEMLVELTERMSSSGRALKLISRAGRSDDAHLAGPAARLIRAHARQLVVELQACVDYLSRQFGGDWQPNILATGGGAALSLLTAQINIESS